MKLSCAAAMSGAMIALTPAKADGSDKLVTILTAPDP